MPKPLAYIETTIPSFYHDTRTNPAVVARRAWTREWWKDAVYRYQLVTSAVVLEELSTGTSSLVSLRLALVEQLPVLPNQPEIRATAQLYIQHKLMPATPEADATHLALASWYHCDFIVTWNCKHLANPNKFEHVRRTNALLGLSVPEIVTPEELLRRN